MVEQYRSRRTLAKGRVTVSVLLITLTAILSSSKLTYLKTSGKKWSGEKTRTCGNITASKTTASKTRFRLWRAAKSRWQAMVEQYRSRRTLAKGRVTVSVLLITLTAILSSSKLTYLKTSGKKWSGEKTRTCGNIIASKTTASKTRFRLQGRAGKSRWQAKRPIAQTL